MLTEWSNRRRMAGLLAVFVLASAVWLSVGRSDVGATSGGDPYAVPNVVDTNPDPHIVQTTLTAEPANVDIGNGVIAHAETFNGSIPGADVPASCRRHGDRPLP